MLEQEDHRYGSASLLGLPGTIEAALPILEQLLDRDASPEEREMLQRSLEGGSDLSLALNNIVDLEEDLIPAPISFVLRDLVQEVAATSMRRFGPKSVDVIVLCDEALGRPILGDAKLLHRLLANVLDNAVRYNEVGGEVLVSVSAKIGDEGDVEVTFDIADTGEGMSGPVLESLFGDDNQHLGFGLRCVRRIVNVMSGEFGIDSMEGDGTSVWIRLPFTVDEDAVEEAWSFSNLNALIVDSGGGARMSLEFECDRLGCRFKSVSDHRDLSTLGSEAQVVMVTATELVDDEARQKIKSASSGRLIALCRDEGESQAMSILGIEVLELPIQRRKLAAILQEIS